MSWVSTVTFLQQSLDQHDLSLSGNLSDRWDGVRHIHDPGEFSFGQPMENARIEGFSSSIVTGTWRRRVHTSLLARLGFREPGISPRSYCERLCKMVEKACISGVMHCGPFDATGCSKC